MPKLFYFNYGNTNNTGGSQNQSGILFPIDGEVSELEAELIGLIKTTGKEKNYELVEYVNDGKLLIFCKRNLDSNFKNCIIILTEPTTPLIFHAQPGGTFSALCQELG